MASMLIEKVITDARRLSDRLKEHDITTNNLISRTFTLQRRLEAMKQYHENLNELNETARHRPRANLILSLAQENSQIRELQQENKELRQSLEEHQSAIELIMCKYREQVSRLMKANRMEQVFIEKQSDCSQDVQEKVEKIYEMAAVMYTAACVDDQSDEKEEELIAQLTAENSTLRQLLQICTKDDSNLVSVETDTQTDNDAIDDAHLENTS